MSGHGRSRSKSPSRRKRPATDDGKVSLPLTFVDIDETQERAVLRNDGSHDIDLDGYYLQDLIGGNRSAAFSGPHVVRAHSTVNIWTAPGGDNHPDGGEETDTDFFWNNRSGGPRKNPVLNNEGDGLQLYNPDGALVVSALVDAFSKRRAVKLTLRFTDIDEEHEKAVLENYGNKDINLKGYHLEDLIGGNSSAPFGDNHVIRAHSTVTVWTAPGGSNHPAGGEETATDFFWMNKSSGPRKHPVLNDEGDGLRLVDPNGDVVISDTVRTFSVKRKTGHATLSASSDSMDTDAPRSASRTTRKTVTSSSISTLLSTAKVNNTTPDQLLAALFKRLREIEREVFLEYDP